MSVRLFLGGLPPGVTLEELKSRFTPFGTVESCEIAPEKVYLSAVSGPMKFSRDFGFVTLLPKDDSSLKRVLGVYNGSNWRGGILRCKVANPSVAERLAEEKAEEEKEAEELMDPAPLPMAEEGTAMRIRMPFNKELVNVVLGGSVKKVERLGKSTDPIPASLMPPSAPAVVESAPRPTFEQHLKRVSAKYPPPKPAGEQEWESRDSPPVFQPPLRPLRKVDKLQIQERDIRDAMQSLAPSLNPRGAALKRPAPAPPAEKSLRSRLAVAAPQTQPPTRDWATVDFLSVQDEREMGKGGAAADLSRFGSDSSSEEGEEEAAAGPQTKQKRMRTIPQVDGPAGLSSSDTNSGGSSRSSEGGSKSSGGGEEAASDEDMADVVADKAPNGMSTAAAAPAAVEEGGKGEGELRWKHDGEDAAWAAPLLPAGAGFYRTEPLVQMEAAWRAGRETAVRHYKDRRRQALRQAGKGAKTLQRRN